MKQDLSHGHGIGFSLFGGQGIADSDKQTILDYNTALKNGVPPAKAWATTMSKASIAAQEQTRQCIKSKGSLTDLANGLQTTSVKANAAALGLKALSIAGNMLLYMAIIKGIQWITTYNQRLEESRQEMIEAGKEASKLTKDLDGLVEQYRKLGEDGKLDNSDREQARSIQEQINSLLGDEVHYIDLSNGSYEHQLELLRKIQHEKANEKYATIKDAKEAAEISLRSKISNVGVGNNIAKSEMEAIEKLSRLPEMDKYLKTYEGDDKGRGKFAMFNVDVSSTEAMVTSYEKMIELRNILSKSYADEIKKGGSLEDFYNNLTNEIDDLSDAVQQYKDAIDDYNINEAVIQFNEVDFGGVKGALIDTKEEMESWAKAMVESDDISDGIKENLIGLAKTYYPELSDAINESVQAHYKEKYAKAGSSSEIGNHIKNLDAEADQCGLTKKAYIELISQEILFNNNNLNVTQKISALQQLAYQAGITADKMRQALMFDSLQKAYDVETHGIEAAYRAGRITKEQRDARKAQILSELNSSLYEGYEDSPGGDTPPYTPSGDDKGSSKDNTPDYEDPTDAIINRINLRADELAQQEEEIQNLIEIAELENDYKKQISLTNDLIATRKQRVEELNKANAGFHNEAEWLRNNNPWDEEKWFDSLGNATEDYYKIFNSAKTKEEQERIKGLFESLSKYKKAYTENAEEIVGLNKEILQSEEEIANIYDDILSEIDRYVERIEDSYDEQSKALDKQITKEEALLKIKQGQFDATNNLKEAQKDIDKEIANSRNSKEYLSDYEYERIFGEADYEYLSGEIRKIGSEINGISANFYKQIEDAYKNDQLYLVEAITAEYERQVAMKERELEIAQAKVDLEKKRLTLENAKAERNIKQYSENGVTWVADQEKVKQAQEDLIDAQAEIKDLQRKSVQQMELDRRQANIDMLNSQKESFDYQLELLNKSTEKLKKSIENVTDPLADLGVILQTLVNDTNTSISNSAQEVASGIGSVSSGSFGSGYSTGEYVPTAKTTNYDGTQNYTDASNIISINGQLFDKSQTDSNGLAKPIENATMVGGFDPKKVYDSGGIASGKGIMLKAVDEEETVLPPWLTKEVLTPEYNENFDKLLKNMQMVSQFNPSDFIVKPQIPSLINNMATQPSITNHWSGDMHVDGGDPNEILRVLQKVFNKVKLQ